MSTKACIAMVATTTIFFVTALTSPLTLQFLKRVTNRTSVNAQKTGKFVLIQPISGLQLAADYRLTESGIAKIARFSQIERLKFQSAPLTFLSLVIS